MGAWALADPYLKAATEEERLAARHAALESGGGSCPPSGCWAACPAQWPAGISRADSTVYAAEFGGMGAIGGAFHYGV